MVPLLDHPQDLTLEKYPVSTQIKILKALKSSAPKLRIVSYNILFNLFDDQLDNAAYAWTHRRHDIVATIQNMHPDILCVQEAYPLQLQDLKQALQVDFACFTGGQTTGEVNAIFYKKARFELLQDKSGSFKLPLDPQDEPIVKKIPHFLPPELEPGRQLTLAHLCEISSGQTFAVLNTHLTFHRINSRQKQARFITHLAEHLNTRVILTGDFNTFPNRPDKKFLPFHDGNQICNILQTVLRDTKTTALLGHVGPQATAVPDFFNRQHKPFSAEEDSDVTLDHIFVSPGIITLLHATEPCLIENRLPSDHMPIIADILLP